MPCVRTLSARVAPAGYNPSNLAESVDQPAQDDFLYFILSQDYAELDMCCESHDKLAYKAKAFIIEYTDAYDDCFKSFGGLLPSI